MIRRALRSMRAPTPEPRVTVTVVDVTGPTIFEQDLAVESKRREDAASLLDEDVIGYVVVRIRRTGACAEVDLGLSVDGSLWPSLRETLARVVIEGDRVFR